MILNVSTILNKLENSINWDLAASCWVIVITVIIVLTLAFAILQSVNALLLAPVSLQGQAGKDKGWDPKFERSIFKIEDENIQLNSTVVVTVTSPLDAIIPSGSRDYFLQDFDVQEGSHELLALGGDIDVISPSNFKIVKHLPVECLVYCRVVASKAEGGDLYSSDDDGGVVYVLSKDGVIYQNFSINHPLEMLNVRVYESDNHEKPINKLYVTCYHCLSVIDLNKRKVVKNIGLNIDDYRPEGLVYNTKMRELYTVQPGSGFILVFDVFTDNLVANISSGFPFGGGIVYDDHSNLVYLTHKYTHGNSSYVSVINGTTRKVVQQIPVGGFHPDAKAGIDINPLTNLVYVSRDDSQFVYVINASTLKIQDKIPLYDPEFLNSRLNHFGGIVRVDASNNRIYTTAHPIARSEKIIAIDGESNKLIPTNLMTCSASHVTPNKYFFVQCTDSPEEGARLNYQIFNP